MPWSGLEWGKIRTEETEEIFALVALSFCFSLCNLTFLLLYEVPCDSENDFLASAHSMRRFVRLYACQLTCRYWHSGYALTKRVSRMGK